MKFRLRNTDRGDSQGDIGLGYSRRKHRTSTRDMNDLVTRHDCSDRRKRKMLDIVCVVVRWSRRHSIGTSYTYLRG